MSNIFRIYLTSNIPEFMKAHNVMARVTLPKELDGGVRASGVILNEQIRKYIPGKDKLAPGQQRLSTGRLKAEFGFPRAELTDNPEFDPSNGIFEPRRFKGRNERWHMEVGTRNPYAMSVNYGFHMKTPRLVNFNKDLGLNLGPLIRLVKPFFFPGYHFIENGTADAEPMILKMMTKKVERGIKYRVAQGGTKGIPLPQITRKDLTGK